MARLLCIAIVEEARGVTKVGEVNRAIASYDARLRGDLPNGGQVDRDAFKTVRRVELLARLELLDGMINEEAGRTQLIREMGWDAAPYEQRSMLLRVTRQHYVALLRQFLLDLEAPDANGREASRGGLL